MSRMLVGAQQLYSTALVLHKFWSTIKLVVSATLTIENSNPRTLPPWSQYNRSKSIIALLLFLCLSLRQVPDTEWNEEVRIFIFAGYNVSSENKRRVSSPTTEWHREQATSV
jgi:hypothetical protein